MDIFGIDLASATLAVLAVVGAVNAYTLFRPAASSQEKFAVSVAVALAVGFIPADLGNTILNHLKDAISVAFVASGTYKISQKIGGDR